MDVIPSFSIRVIALPCNQLPVRNLVLTMERSSHGGPISRMYTSPRHLSVVPGVYLIVRLDQTSILMSSVFDN
jgi:hypothetical protein